MLQGRNSNNYQERAEAIVELSTGGIYVNSFVWDTNTLSWVKMTQPGSGPGTGYEVVGLKDSTDARINPATEDGNLQRITNMLSGVQTDEGNAYELRTLTMNSLVPAKYDEMVLGYTGADLTSVTYKLATVTVATLTLSYNAGVLTGVVKS